MKRVLIHSAKLHFTCIKIKSFKMYDKSFIEKIEGSLLSYLRQITFDISRLLSFNMDFNFTQDASEREYHHKNPLDVITRHFCDFRKLFT